ncbi:MAG: hypothetical protein LBU32_11375 [Clostridiales bacterium]|nr:hypothetical protein [Clostridiales bacterium]
MTFVNSRGTVLYCPKRKHIGKSCAEAGLEMPALKEKEIVFKEGSSIASKERLLTATIPIALPYVGEDYHLSLSAPMKEIKTEAYNVLAMSVVLLLIVTAALIAVIYFSIAKSLKGFRTLARASQSISKGDFGDELCPLPQMMKSASCPEASRKWQAQ